MRIEIGPFPSYSIRSPEESRDRVSQGVFRYSVAHARIRAKMSDLLTASEWTSLYVTQDLTELLILLGDSPYGPYLAQKGRAITPRHAAYEVNGWLAAVYEEVIGVVPDSDRALFQQLRRRFEVDNLKAILRGVQAGASPREVRLVLFPLEDVTVLPVERMLEVRNLQEAMEQLHGTPYHSTLAHAMPRYAAEKSLFPLEVALDLDYYRSLWSYVVDLNGMNKRWALRLIGTRLDIVNLMWAVRYRVYHHLTEEEIINYTLPYGFHVNDSTIRAIATGGDIGYIVAEVFPYAAGIGTIEEDTPTKLTHLESVLHHHLIHECYSAFAGYPFHLGLPLAYILLMELEAQDLTLLIEAKAAKLPPDTLRPYLTDRLPETVQAR